MSALPGPAHTRRRVAVVAVLVVSLLATLVVRLADVQLVRAGDYRGAASGNQLRRVPVSAVRGQILDAEGRVLAGSRAALDVAVDRSVLDARPDRGRAVLDALAGLLGQDLGTLWNATRFCGEAGAEPAPRCFNGTPYQPVTVARSVTAEVATRIAERPELYPGVSAQPRAERDYPKPDGAVAAQLLGYLGPVTDRDLQSRRGTPLTPTDLVGRAGLEQQYDGVLRGTPGQREVSVDARGRVVGQRERVRPVAGENLVTTVDADVQASAERGLAQAMAQARSRGLAADSGAAVVLDVRTGGVVALASAPDYDPGVWVGGISTAEYQRLTAQGSGLPLLDRAIQGAYAPGSTFKVVSLQAGARAGFGMSGNYDCSGSYQVGNRTVRNFEGVGYGPMNLVRALQVSCDTIFYRWADQNWQRLGGTRAPSTVPDPFTTVPQQAGFGAATGIDLPGEASGQVPTRDWKYRQWTATRAATCRDAQQGYPQVRATDPARAGYLTELARENCADGGQFRAGDEVNLAVGQGDVLVTPLQLASFYAAVANGGTLWRPQTVRAVIGPDGRIRNRVEPVSRGTFALDPAVAQVVQQGLREVTRPGGTAASAFANWPGDALPVAGKTGTAEVYGKGDTSWFASYGPADQPRYAVVVMVSQGGTGGTTAAPVARAIWGTLLGVDADGARQPGGGVIAGTAAQGGLPGALPDGTPVGPGEGAR